MLGIPEAETPVYAVKTSLDVSSAMIVRLGARRAAVNCFKVLIRLTPNNRSATTAKAAPLASL